MFLITDGNINKVKKLDLIVYIDWHPSCGHFQVNLGYMVSSVIFPPPVQKCRFKTANVAFYPQIQAHALAVTSVSSMS